jgi:3-hydroxyacyl-CoA dehydrogenase / 3-hydroxy-2-methylbutyryl-CoA dehydrogenase
MQLNKIVAVVTGGASGLGEATVRRVIASGGRAAIFDRDAARASALASELGDRALAATVDVADESSAVAAFAVVMQKWGAIHVCVNCAGIPGRPARIVGKQGPMALADFEKVIRVNLIGTFNISRLAAAEMLKNEADASTGERGVIVNTASLAGIEGQMGQVSYAASKAGVIGMMLPLVRDLSQFGVRVMTIAPGLFETPMGAGAPQELKDKLIATLEFPRRMGKPAEFAHLVSHVIENSYLNGELIRLDAGTRAPPR